MAQKRWWVKDHSVYAPEEDDPQSHKVYRLEREIKGWHKWVVVDESYLNEVAKDACKKFAIKNIPEITVVNKRTVDIGWCGPDGIFLNQYRDGANVPVLLHELAHWITDELYSDDLEGHSPEWAWCYIELLDHFRFLPRWLATQLFDSFGVRY